MQLGQKCLFYASNCKVPGITGLAKVVKTGGSLQRLLRLLILLTVFTRSQDTRIIMPGTRSTRESSFNPSKRFGDLAPCC